MAREVVKVAFEDIGEQEKEGRYLFLLLFRYFLILHLKRKSLGKRLNYI